MMVPIIIRDFEVRREDINHLGEASTQVKTLLKQVGFPSQHIRRVAIAMYEGEVNMAIHADGGTAKVEVYPDRVEILLEDQGPGIPDIEKAMEEGYSTASDAARSLGFGAGMGMGNMKKNTDELTVESAPGEGTCVQMVIYTN